MKNSNCSNKNKNNNNNKYKNKKTNNKTNNSKNNNSKIKKKNVRTTSPESDLKLVYIPVFLKKHYDNKGGHPHIILESLEDKYVSVGLTTKKEKGSGHSNYKLKKSPLNDGKKSYMRRQGIVDLKDTYYNPTHGDMESNDYKQAQLYGERAKNKYINKIYRQNKKK